jgi:hypothetical protein
MHVTPWRDGSPADAEDIQADAFDHAASGHRLKAQPHVAPEGEIR